MAASSEVRSVAAATRLRWLAPVAIVAVLCWAFPLFHVVPLSAPAAAGAAAAPSFDAVAIAAQVWAPLRARAAGDAKVTFAGCAAAPDSVGTGPLLSIVPVSIAVKP